MANNTKGLSGKNGFVKLDGNEIEIDMTNWTIDPSANWDKYGSNLTQGFKGGVSGTRDWSGTITCKVPASGNIPMHDGDTAVAQFHADESGNNYIEGTIGIEGMPIECDVDDGAAITITYNYQGLGPWVGNGIFENTPGSSSGA